MFDIEYRQVGQNNYLHFHGTAHVCRAEDYTFQIFPYTIHRRSRLAFTPDYYVLLRTRPRWYKISMSVLSRLNVVHGVWFMVHFMFPLEIFCACRWWGERKTIWMERWKEKLRNKIREEVKWNLLWKIILSGRVRHEILLLCNIYMRWRWFDKSCRLNL